MEEMANFLVNGSRIFTEESPASESNEIGRLLYKMRMCLEIFSYFLCVLGVVANIVNIVVFVRQGFSESVNITLLSLACVDLLTVVNIFSYRLAALYLEHVRRSPFAVRSFGAYITGSLSFNSTWLAVFISIERTLCIVKPFKVKELITPKVTVIAVMSIAVVSSFLLYPSFWSFQIIQISTTDANNRTSQYLDLTYTANSLNLKSLIIALTFTHHSLSFLCLVLSTAVLVISMVRHSTKRSQALGMKTSDGQVSMRERKVIKMVIVVCSIIIANFTPTLSVLLASLFDKRLGRTGSLSDVNDTLWAGVGVFYSINSSVNIVVYWNMSTRYRQTLMDLLPLRSQLKE